MSIFAGLLEQVMKGNRITKNGVIRLWAKEFEIPVAYRKIKALKGRIAQSHAVYPAVAAEFKRRESGYIGEKKLVYYLNMLPDSNYYIFHNIRLFYRGYYFQIDYLILSASFALVLETKNLTGDIYFDRGLNQMMLNKKRRKNPVLQGMMQARKLKGWMEEHHCPDIPIQYLFVNSNEESQITIAPENEQMRLSVVNSEDLLNKIDHMADFYKMEKLSTKEIRKIIRLILANHTPEDPDILKDFNLSPKELIPGVQCPIDQSFPMKYHLGVWRCSKCSHKSKIAHMQAIEDYFLLIKPSITVTELCQFLKLPSRKVARKILTSMELPHSGTTKGRVYYRKTTTNPPQHANEQVLNNSKY